MTRNDAIEQGLYYTHIGNIGATGPDGVKRDRTYR